MRRACGHLVLGGIPVFSFVAMLLVNIIWMWRLSEGETTPNFWEEN